MTFGIVSGVADVCCRLTAACRDFEIEQDVWGLENSVLWTLVMTEWYLVWVEGLRGPEPQKWSSDGLWGQLNRQDIIVRFPLTDQEAQLSLDQLAKLHPVPLN